MRLIFCFLFVFFVCTALSGCTNKNFTSNYRAIYITEKDGALSFTNQKIDYQSVPFLSFTLYSLTEKDVNGEVIESHSTCFGCDVAKNESEQRWIPDKGFEACVYLGNAIDGDLMMLSVNINKWEWCSNCTSVQTNTTVSTPNSTASTPNSTASTPDSTVSTPDSTVSTPNSTVSTPNSTVSTPNSSDVILNATSSISLNDSFADVFNTSLQEGNETSVTNETQITKNNVKIQKGQYLDVVFLVQNFIEPTYSAKESTKASGKPGSSKQKEDKMEIKLKSWRLKFSNRYESESTPNQIMSTGFPTFVRNGANTLVTVRFERQGNTGNYAYFPVITSAPAPKQPQSSSGSHMAVIPVVLGMCAVGVAFAALLYWCLNCRSDKEIIERLFAAPHDKGYYASLDEKEISDYELEQLEQHGVQEIELPTTDGEDCLSEGRAEGEPYSQVDKAIMVELQPVITIDSRKDFR